MQLQYLRFIYTPDSLGIGQSNTRSMQEDLINIT